MTLVLILYFKVFKCVYLFFVSPNIIEVYVRVYMFGVSVHVCVCGG